MYLPTPPGKPVKIHDCSLPTLARPSRKPFPCPQQMRRGGVEEPLGPSHDHSWLLQKLTLSSPKLGHRVNVMQHNKQIQEMWTVVN